MEDSSDTQVPSNGHTNSGDRGPPTKHLKTSKTSASKQDAPTDDELSVTSPLSAVTSPPYWTQSHSRSVSNISVESMIAGGITLQDNTDDHEDSRNTACWAKGVYIEDHTIINGSRIGIGSFVVWNITVETLHGSPMLLRKRYSEFDDLREKLLQTFPRSVLPDLPRKSVISKTRPKFLEERRVGLQHFLNSVLLNPEFSASPVLKEFIFS